MSSNKPKAISQDPKKLTRTILSLSLPIILEFTLINLVLVVDNIFVGRLGANQFAGQVMGAQINFRTTMIFASLGIGTTAIVARRIGEGDWEGARKTAGQAIMAILYGSIILAPILYVLAPYIFRIFVDDPVVMHYGMDEYYRVILYGMPGMLVFFIARGALRGAGDMVRSLYATLLANVINIVGDAVLIFGLGPFPAMGVKGAAIATVIARYASMIFVIIILLRKESILTLKWKHFMAFNADILKRLSKVSLPSGMDQAIFSFGNFIILWIIGGMGAVQVASHFIAIRVESISFHPTWGLSVAVSTMVGQYLGAGKPNLARACVKKTMMMAVGLMSLFGIIFLVFGAQLAGFFSKDPEVISLGGFCVMMSAFEQPFLAIHMVMVGTLRGSGDTKWALILRLFNLWILKIPLVYFAGVTLGYGVAGIWVVTPIYWVLAAAVILGRYKHGGWTRIKV